MLLANLLDSILTHNFCLREGNYERYTQFINMKTPEIKIIAGDKVEVSPTIRLKGDLTELSNQTRESLSRVDNRDVAKIVNLMSKAVLRQTQDKRKAI